MHSDTREYTVEFVSPRSRGVSRTYAHLKISIRPVHGIRGQNLCVLYVLCSRIPSAFAPSAFFRGQTLRGNLTPIALRRS